MQFIGKLSGDFLGRHRWKLNKLFGYITSDGEVINVPIEFITDGASIPRIFRSFIGSPWDYEYGWGSVIHDFLYKVQIYTRKKSDKIFLETMECKGVALWRRRVIYRAVRMWSWIPWHIHRRRNKKLIPTNNLST